MTQTQGKRLAETIAAGNAVFFVGAGLSLDSEGNSAARLMRRVAARFLAMSQVIKDHLLASATGERDRVDRLVDQFFRLHDRTGMINYHDPDYRDNRLTKQQEVYKIGEFVKKLSEKYYEFNDWCVSALEELANLLIVEMRGGQKIGVKEALYRARKICKDLSKRESELITNIGSCDPGSLPPEPCDNIKKINPTTFLRLGRRQSDVSHNFGKMLFLDAVGFRCDGVMADFCFKPDRKALNAQPIMEKLRRRHIALARFAREGVAPMLLTTNFDRLLEAAYAQVGFLSWNSADTGSAPEPPVLPVRQQYIDVIACAADYLRPRDGGRVCALVKIHGCAGLYRRAYRHRDPGRLRSDLRAIVYTYREVQNWREDAWSRDLLYTLLRTQTLVFAGYSTADPVLHDTIRNAYEEMARHHRGPAEKRGGGRAFAFTPVNQVEFHAQEVLRAAGLAGDGHRRAMDAEEGRIDFYFKNKGFPTTDDRFTELFHRFYRHRQDEALRAELASAARMMLGRRVAPAEVQAIQGRFTQQIKKEDNDLDAPLDPPDPARRGRFADLTEWSWSFHPALLRDLAIDQHLAAAGGLGKGGAHQSLRDGHWYYAAGENYMLTAWGVVIELALRRLAKLVSADIRVDASVAGREPAVQIGRVGCPPWHLCLDFPHHQLRAGRQAGRDGHYRRKIVWRLEPPGQAAPKRHTPPRMGAPWQPVIDAETLWRLALGQFAQDEVLYLLDPPMDSKVPHERRSIDDQSPSSLS